MIFLALYVALVLAALACALAELRRGAALALPSLPLAGLFGACVLVFVGLTDQGGTGTVANLARATRTEHAVDWFAGAAVLACLSGAMLIVLHRRQGARASLTLPGAALLIGAYLGFVVVNQWWFFHAGPGRAGQVSPAWFDRHVRADQRCPVGPIAIRAVGTAAVAFRCPAPTSLVFGRNTPTPFAPWPGYRQGTSTRVARAARHWLAHHHRSAHRRAFVFTDP